MKQPHRTYLEQRLEASGMSREDFAAWVWHCRNLPATERKNRQWQLTYPHQPYGFYVGKRSPRGSLWIPHPQEVCPCCQVLSRPVAAYPHIYHRHCRSLRHVAMLLNVGERDIRARVKIPRSRCSCGRFKSLDDIACNRCRATVESRA